jgi:hypothetical protein
MIPDMSYLIANAHIEDLHREADRARLARLASCCNPSALSGLLSRLRGGSQDCSA